MNTISHGPLPSNLVIEPKKSFKRRPVNDPLARALRKTNREFEKTPLGRLQALWKERSKWMRRETIARNKLQAIEARLDSLAEELAKP